MLFSLFSFLYTLYHVFVVHDKIINKMFGVVYKRCVSNRLAKWPSPSLYLHIFSNQRTLRKSVFNLILKFAH